MFILCLLKVVLKVLTIIFVVVCDVNHINYENSTLTSCLSILSGWLSAISLNIFTATIWITKKHTQMIKTIWYKKRIKSVKCYTVKKEMQHQRIWHYLNILLLKKQQQEKKPDIKNHIHFTKWFWKDNLFKLPVLYILLCKHPQSRHLLTGCLN